jgi:hypothetical protein
MNLAKPWVKGSDQEQEEVEVVQDQSVTAGVKAFLNDDVTHGVAVSIDPRGVSSILEMAHEQNLTLQEYVNQYPDKAVREAEQCLSEWLKIQSMAAIEGCISLDNASFTINKNTTKLIDSRVMAAQRQLDKVNEYYYTAIKDGEKRKDHLIRTLYNRAINKGDTKALVYMIDRVDGRPGETKVTDLDYDNQYNIYRIIHTLFDKQLEVLNSGNGTKIICCSRRAGKTQLCCATVLIEALAKPNTTCIYIGKTMENMEQIIDTTMNKIITAGELRDHRGKRLDWKHLDNGSKILVCGLSNTKDPDKIRGYAAKVIVMDEFFHMSSDLLSYMYREVLKPMQLDYADDYKFLCIGTPPEVKGTFGEHAWKTWEVPHFFWTWQDNPHPVSIEARRTLIEQSLKEEGYSWDSVFARREYGGEWIYDEDLLLYPEYHCYNPRDTIPPLHIDQVLFGIDYGVSDNDTLIGIAWDNSARRGYEFLTEKFNRLDIKDRTISQLQYLKTVVEDAWLKALDYFPDMSPREANKRILWDADDNDQHVTDELNMNIRLKDNPDIRLNITNAHKTDKVMMYDKIRDLLRTADLLLIEGGKTAKECDMTILKRGPNGQVYPEVDMKAYHPDILPALRYALWNVIGQEKVKKE